MATDNITDKNILKNWFKRGLKPLEVQFHAWMDSYWHKSEKIPTGSVNGLEKILNNKAEVVSVKELERNLEAHKTDEEAHIDIRQKINEHTGTFEIHKSSAQIRSEIVDGDIPETIARVGAVDEALALKVDQEAGKGLMADTEKQKLANIGRLVEGVSVRAGADETQATRLAMTVKEVQAGSNGVEEVTLPGVSDSYNGLMTPAYKQMLDRMAVNGQSLDLSGTPSATWHIGKSSGVVVKNSGGVLEVRNAADNGYASAVLDHLTVKGSVVVEGESFVVKSQTVETADNLILLNKGEAGAGVTKGVAGLEIDRGTQNNYKILFDESDDRFKAGSGTDMWPVMLRDNEATLSGGALLVWDAVAKRAKTGKNLDTELAKYTLKTDISLAGYATQSWVQGQGYLTAHQSLAGYVTLSTTQTISGAKTFTSAVISTAGFYDTSDAAVKTRIQPIALRKPVKLYEFDRTDMDKHGFGVIAQEVETDYPEVVTVDETGLKRVNYNEILVIKCRELEVRLEELESCKSEAEAMLTQVLIENQELKERLAVIEKVVLL